MSFRVGGICELVGYISALFFRQFFRLVQRALHALFRGRQHHFRAKSGNELTPFDAHAFRHYEYDLVSFKRAYERESYARISRRRLYYGSAFFQFSVLFSLSDYFYCYPVFHAVRIETFDLSAYFCFQAVFFCDIVQSDQRRSADQLSRAFVYFHINTSLYSILNNNLFCARIQYPNGYFLCFSHGFCLEY